MGNSQYFSLMLVKLVRWRPAKLGKVFPAEKHIHSGQTQMRESLAVIDKVVNTLSTELLVSNAKKERKNKFPPRADNSHQPSNSYNMKDAPVQVGMGYHRSSSQASELRHR